MTEKFDVIVVGAGLGGLSAAASLARRGLGVLLLERHSVPGGYATSFVRGRYEFEVALHELSGLDLDTRQSPLYRYLDYLGVAEQVRFVRVPELYRSVFPDLDLVLPVGWAGFEARLVETFPKQEAGIRRFLGRIRALAYEIWEGRPDRKLGNPLMAPIRFRHLFRALPARWGKVLARDVSDPRARAVLSQLWGYLGAPPSSASFLTFALMLTSYIEHGPTFVKGRSQALANGFVAAIERGGGTVRMGDGVRRIVTSGGRVTGVVTDSGEEFAADRVISNADPVTTTRVLLDEAEVPREFFDSLRPRPLAPGSFCVYMGVDAPPEEIGFTAHENFINQGYDLEADWAEAASLSPPGSILATCYNKVDPDISPPGTSIVVLTTLSMGQPWVDLPPDRYAETKRRIADRMIDVAERLSPGLRDRTEVIEVATPLTNMRFVGALGGSIYGSVNTFDNHSILRLGPRGPVEGLYFCGAWTSPGGGFEPCILSGKYAARAVMADMGAYPMGREGSPV